MLFAKLQQPPMMTTNTTATNAINATTSKHYETFNAIDCFNHLRQTALHLAVCIGNEDIIRILVEKGANIHIVDRNCNNVLHLAVSYSRINCLPFLLYTVMQVAASNKASNKALIKSQNSSSLLNALNRHGLSPLHLACLLKDSKLAVQAIKLLVAAGADIDVRDGLGGRSALMFTLKHRSSYVGTDDTDDGSIKRCLLALGADAYLADYSRDMQQPVNFVMR